MTDIEKAQEALNLLDSISSDLESLMGAKAYLRGFISLLKLKGG